jgi:uncharacterized protein DUF547
MKRRRPLPEVWASTQYTTSVQFRQFAGVRTRGIAACKPVPGFRQGKRRLRVSDNTNPKSPERRSCILALSALVVFSVSIPDAKAFDHSSFDPILKEAVENGAVDYGKVKRRYGDLQAYLRKLEKANPGEMSRNENLAFYVNAYNAHCINGVLSRGEIDSVKDVLLFFKRTRFVLGGKEMSLDSLEHKVLRPMGEPRIHFAIVCSSLSCPRLASRAYRGATLEEDLTRQAEAFFRDPTKNRLDREAGVFHLSKILKWFKKDFTQKAPSVLAYVEPFLSEADRAYLRKSQGKIKVKFLDYDWGLNGHY